MDGEPIGFSENGICFPSRWQFEPGTTLALTLEMGETGERTRAEGIVVGCEAVGERLWAVTMIFLETPVETDKTGRLDLERNGGFPGPRRL